MNTPRTGLLLALALALTGSVCGCSHAGRPLAEHPTPRPTGASAVTTPTTPAAAGSATPAAGSTRLAAPPVPPVADASCAPAVLLQATKRLLDDPARGSTVERVEILACRNGYARLFAVTAKPAAAADNQIFLHLQGGTWQLAGRTGAGTDCGDDGLDAKITAACAGLA
jgi:hypothetical protein